MTTQIQKTLTTVNDMIVANKAAITAALPRHLTYDRVARVALTELRTNPGLLKCTPASLMSCIVRSCQLGFELGAAMGHAYLVPYKAEATLIIGYRGMIDLARRSGQILSISAQAVFANDHFLIDYGTEERIEHNPSMGERGEFIGAYAVAKLQGGGVQFDFMPKSDIDAIRARSRAANNGPWVTDYNEMAKKTVVRRLFKYLPVSIELAQAMADEDRQEVDISAMAEVVDINAEIESKMEEQA